MNYYVVKMDQVDRSSLEKGFLAVSGFSDLKFPDLTAFGSEKELNDWNESERPKDHGKWKVKFAWTFKSAKRGDVVFFSEAFDECSGIWVIEEGYSYTDANEHPHVLKCRVLTKKPLSYAPGQIRGYPELFPRKTFLRSQIWPNILWLYVEKYPELLDEFEKNGMEIRENDPGAIPIGKGVVKIDTRPSNPMSNLNTILYWPPGTGKTYATVELALEIVDPERLKAIKDVRKDEKSTRQEINDLFKKLKETGQIEFATFHQSFSYEEFIEGIRARTDEKGDVRYEIEDGVFKRVSKRAWRNFEMSKNWNETEIPAESLVDRFFNFIENEIEDSDDQTYEIGKELHIVGMRRSGNGKFKSFKIGWNIKEQTVTREVLIRDYPNFKNGGIHAAKDIRPTKKPRKYTDKESSDAMHGNARYIFMLLSELRQFEESIADEKIRIDEWVKNKNYVLVIDEINRGNISKIFWELITLIEPSKRIGASEEAMATLPYSKEAFWVPKNLYVIGTMNTADRSIALMDIALRRRFEFKELLPDAELLKSLEIESEGKKANVGKMLEKMNLRIEALVDRDHTLGHAFFMPLFEETTLGKLDSIFRNSVIPLLQEYFYDDWGKIRTVLGEHPSQKGFKSKEDRIVVSETRENSEVFGFNPEGWEDTKLITYRIRKEPFTMNSFIWIYEKTAIKDVTENGTDDE